MLSFIKGVPPGKALLRMEEQVRGAKRGLVGSPKKGRLQPQTPWEGEVLNKQQNLKFLTYIYKY